MPKERQYTSQSGEYKPPRNPDDFDDPWQRVYLPYSDLQWASAEKSVADRNAIYNRQIPPSLTPKAISDSDWIAKDWDGQFLPGHIDMAESIYPNIAGHFRVYRLGEIKQLALLQITTLRERNPYIIGSHFHHTRLFHSEIVARTTELMLQRLGFDQQVINLGIISGLLHDLATPALGDPTKEIDPEALNEEDNLPAFISENGIDTSILRTYGVTIEQVFEAVKNSGVVGKLLDISDKIAYTALDIYNYSPDPFRELPLDDEMASIMEPIKALMRVDPQWANLYKEVDLTSEGVPYFANSMRLGIFLELRGRMHRALYLNPHCRGLDMVYKLLISPLYSREPDSKHPLNPSILRSVDDYELERIIAKSVKLPQQEGYPTMPISRYLDTLPDYQSVSSPFHISAVIEQLERKGRLVLGSEVIRRFNTGTNFLAVDPNDGKIKPYKEINPRHDYYLESIAEDCNSAVVYFWPARKAETEREKVMKRIARKSVRDYKKQNQGQYPHLSYP